jgi:uncharacterized protein (DUF924 family)
MANYLPDEAADPEAGAVLRFWFGEPPQYGQRLRRWFEKDPAFDALIRESFAPLRERLALGASRDWLEERAGCLAYIVALDQFSRHIHRGSGRAFDADPLALRAARIALQRGFDRALLPVERLFICLPFQHSEALEDQHTGCEIATELRASPETEDVLRFALAHRDIIRRFGRFPHRNAALGRESTAEEVEFLKQPGSSF